MYADFINIGLGFIEGFALIVSPCILPILPLILLGSLGTSPTRPYGMISGFVLIFVLFTFFSRSLVLATGLDLSLVRYLSFTLLLFLSLVMLSTYLTEAMQRLTLQVSHAATHVFAKYRAQEGGYVDGLIMGGLIALVWTPCAGPIFAAVVVQTVIQTSNLMSFLTLFAFGLGAGLPMLMIALFGQDLITRLSFFKKQAVLCRRLLGVLLMLSVAYMFYAERLIISTAAINLSFNEKEALRLQKGLDLPYQAPAVAGIDTWINSSALDLNGLKSKVVLIDFWTYSCINCIRSLPYLKAWHDKYHKQGLVIIGVHSPEFEFEKNIENVKKAVSQYGLKYPIALDNQFVTWRNYQNLYWPAHYLIDKQGQVVYTHFGEGDEAVMENNIQYLLGLVEARAASARFEPKIGFFESPETYLGYKRATFFAALGAIKKDSSAQYVYPAQLSRNTWALQGLWKFQAEYIVAEKEHASIKINFHARKVYLVAGSASGLPTTLQLRFNGQVISKQLQGADVADSRIKISNHRLYRLLELSDSEGGDLELITSSPGLQLYTFTFGE